MNMADNKHKIFEGRRIKHTRMKKILSIKEKRSEYICKSKDFVRVNYISKII